MARHHYKVIRRISNWQCHHLDLIKWDYIEVANAWFHLVSVGCILCVHTCHQRICKYWVLRPKILVKQFLKNGPTSASFSFIFDLFKRTLQFLQQINAKKCPSSIWRRDSNPRPLEHKLSPITTRSGLPPSETILFPFLNKKYFCLKCKRIQQARLSTIVSVSHQTFIRLFWCIPSVKNNLDREHIKI